MIEQPSWPRRVVAAKDLRRGRDLPTQPAKQADPAVEADQRVVIAGLKASLQIGNGQSFKRRRIGAQRIVGPIGKYAARKHVQAGKRQTFRTAYFRACHGIAVAPRGPAPASSSTLTMARSNSARARAFSSRQAWPRPARPIDRRRQPRNAASANGTGRRMWGRPCAWSQAPDRPPHRAGQVDRKCRSRSFRPRSSMRWARARTASALRRERASCVVSAVTMNGPARVNIFRAAAPPHSSDRATRRKQFPGCGRRCCAAAGPDRRPLVVRRGRVLGTAFSDQRCS